MARHPTGTIVVLQEGRQPLPRCTECGMFSTVAETHPETVQCKKWAKREKNVARTGERIAALEKKFFVNGNELESVREFKYLVRILDTEDDDSKAVHWNLTKAKQQWGRLKRVLASKKGRPKMMAKFYMAFESAVLLFGSETWVMTRDMKRRVDTFHHRCARFLMRRHISQRVDRTWECPNSMEVLREAGLKPISELIESQRKTIMAFAIKRDIYQRCVESIPLASEVNHKRWWI